MKDTLIQFNILVDKHYKDNDVFYRVYLDDILYAERIHNYDPKIDVVQENLYCKLSSGEHKIKLEFYTSVDNNMKIIKKLAGYMIEDFKVDNVPIPDFRGSFEIVA